MPHELPKAYEPRAIETRWTGYLGGIPIQSRKDILLEYCVAPLP